MGSLLSVMAMTVAVKAPGALEGAAVKVRTEWPPMVGVDGENAAHHRFRELSHSGLKRC